MNNFMNITKKSIKEMDLQTRSKKSLVKTENGTNIINPGEENNKNLFLLFVNF